MKYLQSKLMLALLLVKEVYLLRIYLILCFCVNYSQFGFDVIPSELAVSEI